MDMQARRFSEVAGEITETLNDMSREYDAKLLAIMYLQRGIHLLRVLETMGVMPADEVDRVIVGSIQDVHIAVPTEDLPETKTIGKPTRLS
jgi:hypothetical protein